MKVTDKLPQGLLDMLSRETEDGSFVDISNIHKVEKGDAKDIMLGNYILLGEDEVRIRRDRAINNLTRKEK